MTSDPAIKACANALAAELSLRALAEERDVTDEDHGVAEAALDTAAATAPTSYAGIAALATLTLEVEAPEPDSARMLVTIRDAASMLAEGERATPAIRGRTAAEAAKRKAA